MNQPSEEQLLAFARAMANIVAADGRFEPEEREELDRVISGLGLSPADEKVKEIVDTEFKNPAPIKDVVAKIEDREMRGLLMRMMAEIACADGDASPEERAKVTEAATAFGYEPAIADELVAWVLDSIKIEQREHELMKRLMQ